MKYSYNHAERTITCSLSFKELEYFFNQPMLKKRLQTAGKLILQVECPSDIDINTCLHTLESTNISEHLPDISVTLYCHGTELIGKKSYDLKIKNGEFILQLPQSPLPQPRSNTTLEKWAILLGAHPKDHNQKNEVENPMHAIR